MKWLWTTNCYDTALYLFRRSLFLYLRNNYRYTYICITTTNLHGNTFFVLRTFTSKPFFSNETKAKKTKDLVLFHVLLARPRGLWEVHIYFHSDTLSGWPVLMTLYFVTSFIIIFFLVLFKIPIIFWWCFHFYVLTFAWMTYMIYLFFAMLCFCAFNQVNPSHFVRGQEARAGGYGRRLWQAGSARLMIWIIMGCLNDIDECYVKILVETSWYNPSTSLSSNFLHIF